MPVPAAFAEVAARVRNWGRWGPDDELGTLNLVDAAARRRAAASVESGRAFALGLPLSEAEGIQMGQVEGRINPSRSMAQVNQPLSPDPEWICANDDLFTMSTQAATHWDALAHVSYGGVLYNGYPAAAGHVRRRRPLRHPPAHHGAEPRRPARRGPRPRARGAGAGLPDHAR